MDFSWMMNVYLVELDELCQSTSIRTTGSGQRRIRSPNTQFQECSEEDEHFSPAQVDEIDWNRSGFCRARRALLGSIEQSAWIRLWTNPLDEHWENSLLRGNFVTFSHFSPLNSGLEGRSKVHLVELVELYLDPSTRVNGSVCVSSCLIRLRKELNRKKFEPATCFSVSSNLLKLWCSSNSNCHGHFTVELTQNSNSSFLDLQFEFELSWTLHCRTNLKPKFKFS